MHDSRANPTSSKPFSLRVLRQGVGERDQGRGEDDQAIGPPMMSAMMPPMATTTLAISTMTCQADDTALPSLDQNESGGERIAGLADPGQHRLVAEQAADLARARSASSATVLHVRAMESTKWRRPAPGPCPDRARASRSASPRRISVIMSAYRDTRLREPATRRPVEIFLRHRRGTRVIGRQDLAAIGTGERPVGPTRMSVPRSARTPQSKHGVLRRFSVQRSAVMQVCAIGFLFLAALSVVPTRPYC